MPVHPRKLDKLKKRLQRVAGQEQLHRHRDLIERIAAELDISLIDCAAALLWMSQPHLFQQNDADTETPKPEPIKPAVYRNVRYRLDVGANHQVSQEQILAALIEESGVDRNRIARLDIRDNYTLVDLPEGMPADIFQLLTEASVNGRRLNIKRVKPNRRRGRDMRTTASSSMDN